MWPTLPQSDFHSRPTRRQLPGQDRHRSRPHAPKPGKGRASRSVRPQREPGGRACPGPERGCRRRNRSGLGRQRLVGWRHREQGRLIGRQWLVRRWHLGRGLFGWRGWLRRHRGVLHQRLQRACRCAAVVGPRSVVNEVDGRNQRVGRGAERPDRCSRWRWRTDLAAAHPAGLGALAIAIVVALLLLLALASPLVIRARRRSSGGP